MKSATFNRPSDFARKDKPRLLVDFDGVLHSYESGWQGADVIEDPPVPGAIDWLIECMLHFNVFIFTTRARENEGKQAVRVAIRQWLKDYGYNTTLIQQLSVTNRKQPAILSIDDRTICFNGSFDELPPESLLQFKPWNKK